MLRCVVIGGSGFVGHRICEFLLEAGHQVSIFDQMPPRKQSKAEFVKGDITSVDSLCSALTGAHVVFHTAAVISANEALIQKVNVDGTRNVIQACRDVGVKACIYTSSASVVFSGTDILSGNESLSYASTFPDAYNKSKAEAETMILQANSKTLLTCALRPHSIYGPGDAHFLPQLVKKLNKFCNIRLGDGRNITDFTFVDNVAHAHILAMQNLVNGDKKAAGKVYFVTDDQPLPQWLVTRWLQEGIGGKKMVISIPRWFILPVSYAVEWWKGPTSVIKPYIVKLCTVHRYFNIGRIRSELGYVPLVNTIEGVRRTIEAYHAEKK